MKKKLRILLVWILVSLIFQFSGHALINKQVEKVMGFAAENNELPITTQLKTTIPGSELTNLQLSYAKDYLAYTENGTLKLFNLKKSQVVFEKKSPSENDPTMGVSSYQWLPDRNNLLYFYVKKKPNEITSVTSYPTKPKVSTSSTGLKTEDPKQAVIVSQEAPPKPRVEKRYGSSQITELYSVGLPTSDEDTAPDDQLHPFDPPSGGEEISKGGKIQKFVISPATNLIYLTVMKNSSQELVKIDIMKKVSTLNKSGELIDNMAISERYGTLYMDSKVGTSQQVVAIQYVEALKTDKRLVISKNPNDRILGIRNGKAYIGEVKNNVLVKIKTTSDLQDVKENPSLKTEWEGKIPLPKDAQSLIGVNGQIIIYDNQTATVVRDGHLKEVKLHGDENYVSADGTELIQLTKAGASSLVELQPLKI